LKTICWRCGVISALSYLRHACAKEPEETNSRGQSWPGFAIEWPIFDMSARPVSGTVRPGIIAGSAGLRAGCAELVQSAFPIAAAERAIAIMAPVSEFD